VLFEGGAGETIRRKLLTDFDLHTMLRLPTGIFYAQGVKANVLFFDKKVARPGQPWTEKPLGLRPADQQALHPQAEPASASRPRRLRHGIQPGRRDKREESERWKSFTYDEITARDKANLDITWLRDESLEDLDNCRHRMSWRARSSRTSLPRLRSSKQSRLRWRSSLLDRSSRPFPTAAHTGMFTSR
jgi:type I restriction enzyme M protein